MIFEIMLARDTTDTQIDFIDDEANVLRRFLYKNYRCILNDCSV